MSVFLACDIITICLYFSNVTPKLYGIISAILRIYSGDTPIFLLIAWEQLVGRGLFWSVLLSLTIVFFDYKRPANECSSLEIGQ